MARYTQAVQWIAENDDTAWVEDGDAISVTAAMAADLFNKTDEQVTADIKKALKRARQGAADGK